MEKENELQGDSENIADLAASFPRESQKYFVLRGDNFLINLSKLNESEKARQILQRFHTRHTSVEKTDVSYRVLSHWDSLNLIEAERDSAKGWRRFNLIERLWVSVITQSRELGLSLDQIARAKPYFFREIPNSLFAFVDYYLIGAIFMKNPVFFVIFSDGCAEFVFYEELNTALSIGAITSYVTIFLNPLLSRIMPKKQIGWRFPLERTVSLEQSEILDAIEGEDFDSFQIIRKKGGTKNVRIVKTFPGSVSEYNLTQGHENVSIENHHDNDGIKIRKRTIYKKL